MNTDKTLKVGIVGAGAMAQAIAIFLNEHGFETMLWSPSGRKLPNKISVIGVIKTRSYSPNFVDSAKELAEQSNVIFFALPANGYKSTMDSIAPYITIEHQVIISAHMSFAAVYLQQLLAARHIDIPIAAWNTTAVMAKKPDEDILNISAIRENIEIVVVPSSSLDKVLDTCRALFPNNFIPKHHILDVTFSNLNPQIHMAMALCNITRMEQQEEWCQRKNVTPTVGRLIEALDAERIAIANAYGCSVKSIMENYGKTNDKEQNVSEINQLLHLKRPIWGPKTAQTRYVLEDAPYGLAVTTKLARLSNTPAPLHEAGVALFSALYGKDFTDENKIIGAIDLDRVIAKPGI